MLDESLVSNSSIFFMVIAFCLEFLAPIALAIYFYKREKISGKVLLVGALSFVVSQILIGIPLIRVIEDTLWYQNLIKSSLFFASLLIASSIGIIEEVGRVYGFEWFLKNRVDWKDGIAFGIGFGGIESMYRGIHSINNFFRSLAINAGTFKKLVANKLSPGVANTIKKQLISTRPSLFLASGLDSLFTLFIQIALTLMALYGIRNHKHRYSIYAIIIHTLIHTPLPYLNKYLGVWGTETVLAVVALIALVLTFEARHWFESSGSTVSSYGVRM